MRLIDLLTVPIDPKNWKVKIKIRMNENGNENEVSPPMRNGRLLAILPFHHPKTYQGHHGRPELRLWLNGTAKLNLVGFLDAVQCQAARTRPIEKVCPNGDDKKAARRFARYCNVCNVDV